MLLGGFQGKGLFALGMVTAQTPSPPPPLNLFNFNPVFSPIYE